MATKAPIKPEVLKNVQDDLIQTHAELIVQGLLDNNAREELKYIVIKEHSHVVKGNEELADYIVQETVGTGIIEEIIKDESITDIGYNGTDLIVESNDVKKIYKGTPAITEDYIVRIIQKFANADGKDFTPKHPILDTVFENIRINAVHKVNSPYGTTMSMRVSRPRLALNKKNFNHFAPEYMYDFFKTITAAQSNIAISGETGTGKTEFQKLLMSFIPFEQKLALIEDVKESHVKEMFKDKDIISWITGNGIEITDLIKAGLRNNPRWIIISETRSKEAYEMIQAVLSGHHIITTLHAVNARAIPKRFVNMAKIGYNVSEDTLEGDIRRYFDFGIHIKRITYKGSTLRYLAEVVEFNEDKDVTIFEQKFDDGKFNCKTNELSEAFKERLKETNIPFVFPENKEHQRLAPSKKVEIVEQKY
ncbi:CpaF/VirB11 family protein [Virgibacillus halodenitrificans]|uniref:CpaF/VirB11 family protein n=1 Tax=Virgibacillus halodenitrificans TaxID=1482 RepID=UPI00045C8D85|nr:CpaF/VirB11 family protein [Virgibacillus halodenitrificans]CDQ37701.1 Putative conjugal transfer proteinc/MT3759 [Virgibacillus halodenitrificans]